MGDILKKDDRSALNPFTGKQHFDIIDDDNFLKQSYDIYYNTLNKYELLDDTPQGILVKEVAVKLIGAVEDYLRKIDRFDYIENYYDWDFHLVNDKTVNAFCMPGGKILMFSGILTIANSPERVAFILGHEIAHALLDHSRTQASVENAKNAAATVGWFGSFALDLIGLGEVGNLTRAAINIADVGSELFLVKPFGRSHELEADKLGMMIIHWAGYDIISIPSFWESMSRNNANNFDFFSTHPSDDKRIENMKNLLIEIENQKDFYSIPVLSEISITNNPAQLKSPKITEVSVNNINSKTSSTNLNYHKTKNPIIEHKNNSSKKRVKRRIKYKNDVNNHKPVNKKVRRDYIEYCPECGEIIGSGDIFCINCGHKLSKRFCQNCGVEIVDRTDNFCFNCGSKL